MRIEAIDDIYNPNCQIEDNLLQRFHHLRILLPGRVQQLLQMQVIKILIWEYRRTESAYGGVLLQTAPVAADTGASIHIDNHMAESALKSTIASMMTRCIHNRERQTLRPVDIRKMLPLAEQSLSLIHISRL